MKAATVWKLKASLSEYLRQVKPGEEVLMTEQGRAIAKLTPAGSSATLPRHLAEMEKQGLIKVGGVPSWQRIFGNFLAQRIPRGWS
jgi:prevent-host-death family protein